MKNKDAGFSVIELLLVIVVIALLVGLGYIFYQRKHKASTASTTTSVVKSQTVAPITGTTSSVDALTKQDAGSESSIDQKHTDNEGTTAQSANQAAANVGGAYNESSL
jgi:prepilin-type N-terminal cleavage/methylation domain-containing protein